MNIYSKQSLSRKLMLKILYFIKVIALPVSSGTNWTLTFHTLPRLVHGICLGHCRS